MTRWLGDTFFSGPIIGNHDADVCHDSEGNAILCYPYALSVWITSTQYAYDLIPISGILLFHYYNFQEQSDYSEQSST